MIRDLRRADAPRVYQLLEQNFPEESALLGNRPEGIERIVRRVLRWDSRLVLGLLRLVGRPLFRMIVVEVDRELVASALITFPPRAAYVSNVVVDPAHRRRGYAKRMLEVARESGRRAGRKYLALDVLDANTPARLLYESLGFRPLRATADLVCEGPADLRTAADPHHRAIIRPFARADVRPLVAIARRQAPTLVEAVLPIGEGAFLGSAMTARMLDSTDAAWVVDRGAGPEGYVAASVSRVSAAGHMAAPVLSETLDGSVGVALARTALDWCGAHRVPRVMSRIAEYNTWGRAALEGVGFRNAFSARTLYRPVD
jgi:ribosomal protein S18 acetylase RimI-like enzyme